MSALLILAAVPPALAVLAGVAMHRGMVVGGLVMLAGALVLALAPFAILA